MAVFGYCRVLDNYWLHNSNNSTPTGAIKSLLRKSVVPLLKDQS